jgi:lipopolysaccharide transport system permease protein
MNKNNTQDSSQIWENEIKPSYGWKFLDFKELFKYKDLIYLFVKRDIVVFYKQTILGPLWYIIQPIFNSVVFTIVFTNIANIPTEGVPPFLFYLAGSTVWGFFAYSFDQNGRVFVSNAQIFGKVYFPRITVPISISIASVFQFLIQFIIFFGFLMYFKLQGGNLSFNLNFLVFIPLIILQIGLLSIGFGMLVSSLTAKYRDLTMAMAFMIQLWMYMTPIVYPLSEVPEDYKFLILLNPMTAPVEIFREAFLGVGSITSQGIYLSISITIIFFLLGSILFNRVEKNFMDTV